MIKGIAFASVLAFLGLSFFSSSTGAGLPFFLVNGFVFVIGATGVGLLILPEDFLKSVWMPLLGSLPSTPEALAAQIETVARVIREDGLLALESKRREISNPGLKHLLKRIMEGFECQDLEAVVRNQDHTRMELIAEAEAVFSKIFFFLPQIGLVQSLILISTALSSQHGGASGIARGFFPFLTGLVLQMTGDAVMTKLLSVERKKCILYFSVLRDGVAGIAKGENPVLIRDRIRARLLPVPEGPEN